MPLFRTPYDLLDGIFDVYTQPQVDLFPLIRIESPKKKAQKRVKSNVSNEESKSTETQESKDMVEEPETNKSQQAAKRPKVFHSSNISSPFASFLKSSAPFMTVDIDESDFTYRFRVDVPGLTRDQISLDLDDNNLFTISATRDREEAQTKLTFSNKESDATKGHESSEDQVDNQARREDDADANDKEKSIEVCNVLQERAYGKMERVFHLRKEVDADNISATLENGVLNITIPQRRKAPAKKITIN